MEGIANGQWLLHLQGQKYYPSAHKSSKPMKRRDSESDGNDEDDDDDDDGNGDGKRRDSSVVTKTVVTNSKLENEVCMVYIWQTW